MRRGTRLKDSINIENTITEEEMTQRIYDFEKRMKKQKLFSFFQIILIFLILSPILLIFTLLFGSIFIISIN
jgi:hypothetical protein